MSIKSMVYIGTSLDGFIARKNGDIDWLVQFANDEAIQSYKKFIKEIDAIVVGKGTFEKVLSFPKWPYEKNVFVLSSSLKSLTFNVPKEVTILSMKPKDLLVYLKEKGFSRVYIDGGKVIQSFLKEDLIDELTVAKVPILIGSGIPLFDHIDIDLQFSHLKTDIQSNGLVRSYYRRNRKTSILH